MHRALAIPEIAECDINMSIIFRTGVGYPLVGHGRSGSTVQPASWFSKRTRGLLNFRYIPAEFGLIYADRSIFRFQSMPVKFLTDLQVESASTV